MAGPKQAFIPPILIAEDVSVRTPVKGIHLVVQEYAVRISKCKTLNEIAALLDKFFVARLEALDKELSALEAVKEKK